MLIEALQIGEAKGEALQLIEVPADSETRHSTKRNRF
jgi:hypothetical protein